MKGYTGKLIGATMTAFVLIIFAIVLLPLLIKIPNTPKDLETIIYGIIILAVVIAILKALRLIE